MIIERYMKDGVVGYAVSSDDAEDFARHYSDRYGEDEIYGALMCAANHHEDVLICIAVLSQEPDDDD